MKKTFNEAKNFILDEKDDQNKDRRDLRNDLIDPNENERNQNNDQQLSNQPTQPVEEPFEIKTQTIESFFANDSFNPYAPDTNEEEPKEEVKEPIEENKSQDLLDFDNNENTNTSNNTNDIQQMPNTQNSVETGNSSSNNQIDLLQL